jgi:putative ABC transport system permease protein
MNFLQIILKQMRQRSLSTWLTMMSVLLGVALAIAILVLNREGHDVFAQADYGYDVLVGPPKGSPLQLTLNTVYNLDVSPGVIPYSLYEDLTRATPPMPPPGRHAYANYVKLAVPFMVGDSYKGKRIMGTTPLMFGYEEVDAKSTAATTRPAPFTEAATQAPWHETKLVPVDAAHHFQYRKDKPFEFAKGRVFQARKFEAVIGSEVAEKDHLVLYDNSKSEEENEKLGGAFRATHGFPSPNQKPDIHKPRWHVVGILKPTHTANDRTLFVPIVSLYAISEHEKGMIAQTLVRAGIDPNNVKGRLDEVLAKLGMDPANIPESVKKQFKLTHQKPVVPPGGDLLQDIPKPGVEAKAAEDEDAFHLDEHGDIIPDVPQKEWMLSGVFVRTRGGALGYMMTTGFKTMEDRGSAVNPASVMNDFFRTFLAGSTTLLLIISALVSIVAAASIMTTIYNSVSARRREIAILRALGATRVRILSLICFEAALVGLVGGVVGLVAGHALCAAGSSYLQQTVGEGIHWMNVSWQEGVYLLAVVAIAFLAGLVPALKAYSTPVATNLAAT